MTEVNTLTKNVLQIAPLFDPETGETVIRPAHDKSGFWVGAPCILWDEKERMFYLYYRVRNPRDYGAEERGFEVRIARSPNGKDFEDVWKLHKSELNSSSIERSSLVKVQEDLYRLYISYVDPIDNRWRIDLMEAQSPTEFDPRDRKKILTALDIEGAEGVKDPYMVKRGSQYFMYFVYAKPISGISHEDMHRTGDVHNTGYAVAETGLAVSEDGINFRFIGKVLPVGISGWDQYQSRITTIIPYKGVNTVLWDGSFGVEQNFEEQASIAVSVDLITFAKIANGPVLETRMGKSIRYVDAIIHDNTIWYYYEYCTEGGAHELRLCRIPLGE